MQGVAGVGLLRHHFAAVDNDRRTRIILPVTTIR